MKEIRKSFSFSDGRTLEVETGRLARQANGSVVVSMGNTRLMATVVAQKEARDDVDFMPLMVDYKEKFSSTGKIPGGFFKREGRLSDYEILISRLVDRALRPMFPSDFHAETQVILSLYSSDKDIMPDALAAFAASCALAVSDIPFNGPISEVRVGKVDGKLVINPGISQMDELDIDMMLAGDINNVLMVEGEANECSEEELSEVIRFGHDEIKRQCAFQLELAEEVGSMTKRNYDHENANPELSQAIRDHSFTRLQEMVGAAMDKQGRSTVISEIKDSFFEGMSDEEKAGVDKFLFRQYFKKAEKEAVRRYVLDNRVRLDGRKLDEIRPIWSEVDYLPSTHGSAVFTRGETQALSTVTLGNKMDEQMIDGAVFEGSQKFMLHYNFPPFSTGEAKFLRGASRREVGHGHLAMRSLNKMVPKGEENPYTIKITTDILESNGSSSMATVCSGTLALMDAGIPLIRPVSGIAMGLITDGEKHAVLSDILGDEDFLGDMDFKVTGTTEGICAVQMDMKVDGLSYAILEEALMQAKEGRAHILNKMMETLDTPNESLKPHAPRVIQLRVDREHIGAIIGPGGKIIQEIQRETGTDIMIEEVDNAGSVQIFSPNEDGINKAVNWIKQIVAEPEVGETYTGKVKTIMPFGAFVEFMPGKDGLLHISEITWERLEDMDGVMKEGDEVTVKLIEVDPKTGKFRLSKKVLEEKPEGYVERPPRSRDGGGRGRGDRRGGNRDRGSRDRDRGGRDRGGSDRNRGDSNSGEKKESSDNKSEE